MFDRTLIDRVLKQPYPDRIAFDGNYKCNLAQAVSELGILVGEGTLDTSTVPTTASHYDPEQAVNATISLASNANVVTVADMRQDLSQLRYGGVQAPSYSHGTPSTGGVALCKKAFTTESDARTDRDRARPVSAPVSAARFESLGPLSSIEAGGGARAYTSLHRPRATTAPVQQPSQALIRSIPANGVPTSITHRPSSLEKLGKYVEASVERFEPRTSGIALSGDYTPGGFGLRVRSQTQTVEQDARTGETVGYHSMELLERDTKGNSRISNTRSDLQGSWFEVQQAMQLLQKSQGYIAW